MKHYLQKDRFKKMLLLPVLLSGTINLWADSTIKGKVTDEKGKPVRGASVYLENTLDGGTSDSLGSFKFSTSEKGKQTIVATEVSHATAGMPIEVNGDVSDIVLKMKSVNRNLEQVVITAGSFEASNDKDKTVLKPLDIVTTAGAQADVVKAMQTLPGTQQTGTENGLFVRGGDASEASVVVDEMIVQNAFFGGPPGVATRSRFGAFQFQGVSFSSGGYSSRYGQALSSVLELQSLDLPEKSNVNLGLNMAGIYASGTKLWKNSSIEGGLNYTNLSPFYGLANSNFKFYDVPVGGGANMRYTWKPNKNGIFKLAANGTFFNSGIAVPNPYANDTNAADAYLKNMGDTINYKTSEQNYYSNMSYRQMFKTKYSLYTAASVSYNKTDFNMGTLPIKQEDHREQFRIEGKDYFNSRLNLLLGMEIQNFGMTKTYYSYGSSFTETQIAGYTELEWSPVKWLAFRPGLRYEHSVLLNKDAIAPRFSMAIKTSDYSQVSLAGGMFYQDADPTYLIAGFRPVFQQANHYIANWQWNKNDRTLRLEGYYKDYASLVREQYSGIYDPNTYRMLNSSSLTVDNTGHGYAKGLELFWRDKKSVKNMDYWISYSYIDTKRLYGNYKSEAQPTFIADHNLNLVGKYFIDKWQTNISATYTYATGRPYYNPNNPLFLDDRTPAFQNLALTFAYLRTFGKWFTVFYISLDNITDQHNVFGYRYSYDGQTRYPMVPALYRSVFVGVNMSLTQFKKDEL